MAQLSPSLLAAIGWVIVISVIGMLPRRFHPWLGLPMLVALIPLLVWIGYDAGIWWVVGLLAGAMSIFRYPLRYFLRFLLSRLRGHRGDAG